MTRLFPAAIGILMICSTAFAQEGPRVFVTDSQSYSVSGGISGNNDSFSGSIQGGARPQTAEIIKNVQEKCEGCIVTNKKEKADYILILDHEGGKGYARKDNKFAVFNKDGDLIASGSTRTLGNSVKDATKAILKDWANKNK